MPYLGVLKVSPRHLQEYCARGERQMKQRKDGHRAIHVQTFAKLRLREQGRLPSKTNGREAITIRVQTNGREAITIRVQEELRGEIVTIHMVAMHGTSLGHRR